MAEKLSRRAFIARIATAAAAPSLAIAYPTGTAKSCLTDLSAVEAVTAMTRGDLTAERYASALLQQCAAAKDLNAFITLDPARVLEFARECDTRRQANSALGVLHGLPIPVKDSINTKDYPTTAGTPALRHFRPADDAPLVRVLKRAGAFVLGKTNMHELSFGWTSNNRAFGTVHNPYNKTHVSGGSSGGTAAAVAARMAPLGIAEDTEGSIRIPAALCGIAGFRPTTRRYPTAGVVPITPVFDQLGTHARSVTDLLLFDSIFSADRAPESSRRKSLRGLKLGIGRDYWFTGLDANVERVVAEALRRLQDAGAELVDADVPNLAHLIQHSTAAVQSYDFRPSLTEYLKRYRAGITYDQLLAEASPDVKADIAMYASPGGRFYASQDSYRAACSVYLPALRATFRQYFSRTGVAAVVFPTTMTPAPLVGEDLDVTIRGERITLDVALGRNVDPGSTAGLPGLVLPAGLTPERLPVSLEFDAPAGTDRTLLSLGVLLEAALGTIPAPTVSCA